VRTVRWWLRRLAVVQAVLAAAAVWGGVSLIVGAPGFTLPSRWLEPLGLRSWVLPGVALIVGIGGMLAVAGWLCWRGSRNAVRVSLAAGWIVLAWVGLQLLVFGLRAPVQVITAVFGLAIVGLAVGARRARRAVVSDHDRRAKEL
jgi:hypothetical protein